MENSARIGGGPLRLLFVTREDLLYAGIFFEEFLKRCGRSRYDIAGAIVISENATGRVFEDVQNFYGMYGVVDRLRLGWRYYRSRRCGRTLKDRLDSRRIPSHTSEDLEKSGWLDRLEQQGTDIVISLGAPGAVQGRIAGLARWGCLNIHQARLTDYRGNMPGFWQMFNEEKTACVTIHKLNGDIQKDRIVLQKEFPIWVDESLDHLLARMSAIAAESIVKVLGLIRNNKIAYLCNGVQPGAYFSLPTRADVREFKRRGKRIF